MLVWNYLHQVPSKSKKTSHTIIHVVYELDSPVGNVHKLWHVGGISSANKNRPPLYNCKANKGNNKITEHLAIFQRERQNS